MSTEEKPSKKKRDKPTHRSRAYPAITLEAAIERTKTLYDNDKRHPILTKAAVSYWGLAEGSGTAIRTLAALRHYGLTEATGHGADRRIRVSDLGMEIVIHPHPESAELIGFVQQAALNPPFFKELWDKYGGELPNDVSLKHELERTGDLNANIIAEFISTLRANLEFAKLGNGRIFGPTGADKDENKGKDEKPDPSPGLPPTNPLMQVSEIPVLPDFDLPVPLSGARRAILRLPQPISRAEYDYMRTMLSTMLEGMKDMLATIEVGRKTDDSSGAE